MKRATIVMYHYVRDQARSPGIKARSVREFVAQLDYFASAYSIVRMEDIMAAAQGGEDLPDDALLLTFDDGYADHYDTVFPRLADRGMQGSFFVPATVLEGHVLDVNKIQFVLACQPASALIARIKDTIARRRERPDMRPFVEYWREHSGSNGRDDEDTSFVKRMLQYGLPEDVRSILVDGLFREFVSDDSAGFAADLYLDRRQIGQMLDAGMFIGGHGDRHVRLDRISDGEQAAEIERTREFLDSIGSGATGGWVMCYPHGAHDDRAIERLTAAGCVVGLTTRSAIADLDADHHLRLPRLDTISFPTDFQRQGARSDRAGAGPAGRVAAPGRRQSAAAPDASRSLRSRGSRSFFVSAISENGTLPPGGQIAIRKMAKFGLLAGPIFPKRR